MKIGYATIQGYTHRKLEYNNQDSVGVFQYENCKIGIITDGCGSAPHSEVGAQLAIPFIARFIKDNIEGDWKSRLKPALLDYASKLAELHSNHPEEFIRNFLLYTIVGFVEVNHQITIFTAGDGVVIFDGKVNVIDQQNRPKYINNELLGKPSGDFSFQDFPVRENRIILGSDGLEDLLEAIAENKIEEYSDRLDFEKDDTLYDHPIALPKLLQKYARNGIIKDDCSIIMIQISS